MALPGADSPAQIHFHYGESEVSPQIRCHGDEVPRKFQARVAPLPDHRSVRLRIRGLERQFFAVDSAGRHLFHRHGRIDTHQRLRRGDSQFIWVHPAPDLPGVKNMLEQRAGSRSAQPPQGLDRLHSREARRLVVLHQLDQFENAAMLSAHAHFVDGQGPDQHIERIVQRNEQLPALFCRCRGQLPDRAIMSRTWPLR